MSRAFVNLRLERLETRWMLAADAVPLDDVYTLETDGMLQVSAEVGVLVNDGLEGETAELVDTPSHGELTFRADGAFTYTAGEGFPGTDAFTYRIAGSASDESLATVTLGLAESLEDIVRFRLEVVDLGGNPVASAPVGALLELRVLIEDVPDRANVGPAFAGYLVRGEGTVPDPQSSFRMVNGYYVASTNPTGGSDLDFASGVHFRSFRLSDAGFEPGEQLIARTFFTVSEPGTLTLAAERIMGADKYGLWPVHLGDDTAESLRNDLQFVAYGQIDFGAAVSVQFVASDNTPPVANREIYHVDESGMFEVDAATGVLANDTDADGDALTARVLSAPRYGQVTLNADGSFRYVQDSGDSHDRRLEHFSYLVEDGVSARIGGVWLVLPSGVPVPTSWQNRANPIDVNGDGFFSSDDEWILGYELEKTGPRELAPPTNIEGPPPFLDVNGDGVFSHADIEALYADYVLFRLQPVSLDGSPIDQVTVGESFAVQVRVEDLRDDPRGVFAAYLDVEYDPALVSLDGELQFGDIYVNDISGDTSRPGLIDEAGAFSGSIEPLGGGEFTVFTARFTATAAGEVVFSGNPADDTPARDVNVYGWDFNLSDGQTGFEDGSVISVPNSWIAVAPASLTVVAATDFAQDDSVVVEHGGSVASLHLLANDEATQIVEVTNGSKGGEVSISADGASVHYTPPSIDFIGVETFQYTALNSDGATDTASVTVQVRSRFQNPLNPPDVNDDGHVTPLDVLLGINQLNERGPRKLTADDSVLGGTPRYLDANGDGTHSALDVLVIINHFNATAEGEFSPMEANVPLPATEPILAGQATLIAVTTQTAFREQATSPETQKDTEEAPGTNQQISFVPAKTANDARSSLDDLRLLVQTRHLDPDSLDLEDILQPIVSDVAQQWWIL